MEFLYRLAGKAVVVSVILEKSGWQRSEVAKYQVLPPKGRPVRDRKPIGAAWYEVREGLRKVLEELSSRRS